MRVTVTAGMVGGTASLALLTRIDAASGYGAFVLPLVLLGLAIGLALSPCTDAIMGAFPESELGVGGAVNDTSIELGGSLGIAILGSVLSGAYSSHLADAVGGKLPAAALSTAQDSVGAGLAVAQKVGAQAGPEQAQALVKAVDGAFSDAVAHTSLVGAVVLGVGTVLVALLVPGRGRRTDRAEGQAEAVPAEEPVSTSV